MGKRCAIVLSKDRRCGVLLRARRCRDAEMRTRLLIVFHSAVGRAVVEICRGLSCHSKTVRRVRERWLEEGYAGLVDRREDNGDRKVTEEYAAGLLKVLEKTAPDHGHHRPTWTLALLIRTMHERQVAPTSCATALRPSRTARPPSPAAGAKSVPLAHGGLAPTPP